MPFQPINFLNAPLSDSSGVGDFVQNLLKGFEAARKPTQIRQEEEMRRLNNEIQGVNLEFLPKEKQAELAYALMRNKYYGPEKEGQIAYQNLQNQYYAPKAQADLDLSRAQLERALRPPERQLTDVEKLIQGLKSVEASYGKNTDEYNQARQFVESKIRASGGVRGRSPEDLTPSFITSTQKTVQAIDNALPMISQLEKFKAPGQLVGGFLQPNQQAEYESITSTITDSLVNALGLPKTNESIALVAKTVVKKPLETQKAYVARLGKLSEELKNRRDKAVSSLSTNSLSGAPLINKEEGPKQTKTINGKKYYLIDGEWYE